MYVQLYKSVLQRVQTVFVMNLHRVLCILPLESFNDSHLIHLYDRENTVFHGQDMIEGRKCNYSSLKDYLASFESGEIVALHIVISLNTRKCADNVL